MLPRPKMSVRFATTLMTALATLLPTSSFDALPAAEASPPAAPMADYATLVIQPRQYEPGYYDVFVSGRSSLRNTTFGVSVYGEDTWFDDWLFYIGQGETNRTDGAGNFFAARYLVYRNVLNEDWEGQDEIFAIVRVGGREIRTNTVRRSF